MLYSVLINTLRSKTGDIKRRQHVEFEGDAVTSIFQMPTETFPVFDDPLTVTVAVGGAPQTETTDYTLDDKTGTLTFVSTPGSGVVITIDCFAVHALDADWLELINETVRSLGNDFFREVTDDSLLTTTANMLSLDLTSTFPQAIAVYELWKRDSATEDWRTVGDFSNWRYEQDNNTLYFGRREDFPLANKELKIRLLNGYIIGDEVTDTFDVQDKFLTIIYNGAQERYWEFRYQDVVELVTKQTTEPTRTRLQELMMLADRYRRLYEQEKAKLKPQKPSRIFPVSVQGGGRP